MSPPSDNNNTHTNSTNTNLFQNKIKKKKAPIFGSPSNAVSSSSIFNGSKKSPTSALSNGGGIFNMNKIKKKKKFKPTIYGKDGGIIQGGKDSKDVEALIKNSTSKEKEDSNNTRDEDGAKNLSSIDEKSSREKETVTVTDANKAKDQRRDNKSDLEKKLAKSNSSQEFASNGNIKNHELLHLFDDDYNKGHIPSNLDLDSPSNKIDEKPHRNATLEKKEKGHKNVDSKNLNTSELPNHSQSQHNDSFKSVSRAAIDTNKELTKFNQTGNNENNLVYKGDETSTKTIIPSVDTPFVHNKSNMNSDHEKIEESSKTHLISAADHISPRHAEGRKSIVEATIEKDDKPHTSAASDPVEDNIDNALEDKEEGEKKEKEKEKEKEKGNMLEGVSKVDPVEKEINIKSEAKKEVLPKTSKENFKSQLETKSKNNITTGKEKELNQSDKIDSKDDQNKHSDKLRYESGISDNEQQKDRKPTGQEDLKKDILKVQKNAIQEKDFSREEESKSVVTDINDSEAETDIADSPPRPRRGRLIRKKDYDHLSSKGRHTNSDEESIEGEYIKYQKVRNNSRHNSTSRSVSPSHSKSSSRKPSRIGRDANGRTKLQKLCEKGRYKEAKQLIESGFDVNVCDYAGNTALHEAALKGHVDIVELLIDNGAIVDKQSGPDDLDTPLIDAAANGHLAVVKLLLQRGADPRISNAQGDTAVDSVDLTSEKSSEIHKVLRKTALQLRDKLKSNGNIHQANPSNGGSSSDESENDSVTSKKVNKNLSRRHQQTRNDFLWVDVSTKTGRETMIRRAAEGDVEYIGNYLIKSNTPDNEAFVVSARNGHTDLVSLMLAFGADANCKNSEGFTALSQAVGRGHLNTVKLLLESGAEPNDQVLGIARNAINYDDEEVLLIEDALQKSNTESSKKRKLENGQADGGKEKSRKVKRSATESEDEKQKSIKNELSESTKLVDSGKHKTNEKIKMKEKAILRERSKSRTRESSVSKENGMKETEHNGSPLSRQSSHTFGDNMSMKDEVSESRSPAPVTPTISPEEERLQKLKDLESREAYERKKSLKKKLNSQKMLSDLSEQAKRKEEEKRKAALLEQERINRKMEEEQREAKLAAEKAKHEFIVHEIEERKRIRSAYPEGLRVAKFNCPLTENEIIQYFPLYFVVIDSIKYFIDLQIILMTAQEKFNQQYPNLTKIQITGEQKAKIWNFFFPLIGFDKSANRSTQELSDLYDAGEHQFLSLDINWIKASEVEKLLETTYQPLFQLTTTNTSTEIDLNLSLKVENPHSKSHVSKVNGETAKFSQNNYIPLKFRNRQNVLKCLKVAHERLW